MAGISLNRFFCFDIYSYTILQESMKDTEQIEKLQQLQYLIQMLLPVLKKMNLDHSIELEIEAKIKGSMT